MKNKTTFVAEFCVAAGTSLISCETDFMEVFFFLAELVMVKEGHKVSHALTPACGQFGININQ